MLLRLRWSINAYGGYQLIDVGRQVKMAYFSPLQRVRQRQKRKKAIKMLQLDDISSDVHLSIGVTSILV